MGAGFLILEGRDAGKTIPFGTVPFNIGRLPENQLVLADDQVSRKHARVEESAGGFSIVDLQSRNGVTVNDKKISRHPLTVGDRVRIGGTTLVFHTDIEQARQILSSSIPDSPQFALESNESSMDYPAEDSPTAIRRPEDEKPAVFSAPLIALSHASRLFRSSLAPKEIITQFADLVFQTLTPDRLQVIWKGFEDEVQIARSRKEGRSTKPFPLPPEIPLGKKDAHTIRLEQTKSLQEIHILAVPMTGEGGVRGWLYIERFNSPTFRTEEVEQIETLVAVAGGALDRSQVLESSKRLQQQISLMAKHLSPEVARMLASKKISIEESALHVEKREVTVLFADIVGFTPLSERLSAEELAQLLNEYFQRMVDVILSQHGTLNKFIGDAIMALFGAPETHGNDAANAVAVGLKMVETLQAFWKEIDERKRFQIRVGINTGMVVAGNIGSEKKMEYTVLGDAVNVASRLEGISPANRVTIGPRTAELVKNLYKLELVPSVKVKGKSAEMSVFRVSGLK